MENKKTNKISSEVNTLNYRLKQKQQTSMKKKRKTENKPTTTFYLSTCTEREKQYNNTHTKPNKQVDQTGE